MFALTLTLWRSTHGTFSLTGWGVVTLLWLVTSAFVIFDRD